MTNSTNRAALDNELGNHESENIMKRVLIVDDSKVIRDRLVSLLSDIKDVEIVGEAIDAEEAIRLHQSTNPDFVILDLRIPGGGGLSVLQEIKKTSPETKVVILTSFPYITYRLHCIKSGANYFLNKSTEFEQVKSIITTDTEK